LVNYNRPFIIYLHSAVAGTTLPNFAPARIFSAEKEISVPSMGDSITESYRYFKMIYGDGKERQRAVFKHGRGAGTRGKEVPCKLELVKDVTTNDF
jgi:hypothetical protein